MHELPPRLKKALITVSETLARLGVRWVLVGSTASYLNGVEVEPKDIDIIVEADKVYEVDETLASSFRALRRVMYSSSKTYSSHYGVFEILGIKVEIMADLKICGEPGCLNVDFEELHRHSRNHRVGDENVKAAPLEWQLVANTLIPGKEKRIVKILEALRTRGMNTETLNSVLSHAPPKVRKKVSELLSQHP